MKRFIEGDDRTQSTLFPAVLADYIDEDNPVRVIDAFIDALDLGELGFNGVVPEATGRPSYELCWKMGDAARSGGAGFGDIVHGDAVGELDAFDELGQLIPPVQPPPGL